MISELRKQALNQGTPIHFYFWRDSSGNEVDLLIEQAGKLRPIEIKSGQTINRDYFTTLRRWNDLADALATDASLVYGGEQSAQRNGVTVQPWVAVDRLLP